VSAPEPVADPLAEALQARGFGLTHDLILTDPGPRKIMAIKTVRELVWIGLKDAKDLVEGCGTVLHAVDSEIAAVAATALAEAGAQTQLRSAYATQIGYAPRDPAGAEQTLERLRVDARSSSLALDRGVLGQWTWAEPRGLAGGPELLAAIDERLAAWAEAGWRGVAREIDVLDAFTARDPSAEQRLRAGPPADRPVEAEVYGDWLQARGQIRGRLAALTLAPASPTRDAELDRLVLDHAAALFGPARDILADAQWTWLGPVLDTLELPLAAHHRASPNVLSELLELAICACLRSLTIAHPFADFPTLAPLIAASPCAPGLRALIFHGPPVRVPVGSSDPAAWRTCKLALPVDVCARLERLERLELWGANVGLGPARLPALRELSLDLRLLHRQHHAEFRGLELPQLEGLELHANTTDEHRPQLEPLARIVIELLRVPVFARLRRLVLVSDSVPLGPEFAAELAQLPAAATLEHIDLRQAVLDPPTASQLRANRARLPTLLLPGDP
jgi:hypothetical protein